MPVFRAGVTTSTSPESDRRVPQALLHLQVDAGDAVQMGNFCIGLFDTCPRDTKVRRMMQA
jgi:hypothetical protein